MGSVTLHWYLASLVSVLVSWKHRNNGLKIVLKCKILSLFTKSYSLEFQLRHNENFSMFWCKTGFVEYRIDLLGTLGTWLTFITFTKFSWKGICWICINEYYWILNFCFKCWKETLWFYSIQSIIQYEIFTPDIALSTALTNFEWLKFGGYTLILKKLLLNLVILLTDKILFFLNFMHLNTFLHFSISLWVYIMNKNQPCIVNRCYIARTPCEISFP